MLLIRRQAAHPVFPEEPMHRRSGDGHVMKPLQIVGDSPGPEVVRLPQVQGVADNGRRPWPEAIAGVFAADRTGRLPRRARAAACDGYVAFRSVGRPASLPSAETHSMGFMDRDHVGITVGRNHRGHRLVEMECSA